MSKRKLTIILMLSLGFAAAFDLSLVFALALYHKPFAATLAGAVAGFIPALIVASMAWRRPPPSSCDVAR